MLEGSLAPDGAVIKQSAASPELLNHTGRAVVFENYEDMHARIDDDDLDVTKEDVLVLKSAGPVGGPGIPEWGMLPIPKKLLEQGIRDMVRISDARMSGTAFGTVVLHISPESALGGPLGLVENGDMIKLDVEGRRIDLLVDDAEMERRKAAWVAPAPKYTRGYGLMFSEHVMQAQYGCDFDFLVGNDPVETHAEMHSPG
jgi:dihydroxy-acid dehydratase